MAADKGADRDSAERGSGPDETRLPPGGPGRPGFGHDQVEPRAGSDVAAGPGAADRGSGGDGRSTPGDAADGGVADGGVADGGVADGGVADTAGDTVGEDPLTICLAQRDEYLDSLRRLQAEFENYKKRVIKQQADQVARAAVSLLEKILPVLDTLDLAIEHVGDPGSVDGRALEAVYSQLRDVLTKEGLERISPIGERFDPNTHEAVGHLPADVDPSGDDEGEPAILASDGEGAHDGEPVVAQVMRAGYRWRGSVVRPAMVMVRG